MAEDRVPPPPDRLPTLTEILEFGPGDDVVPTLAGALPWPVAAPSSPEGAVAADGSAVDWLPSPVLPGPGDDVAAQADVPAAPEGAGSPPVTAAAWDEEALTCRIVERVQARLDAVFEARLREALAPALARAADGLIREARAELAPLVQELVAEAVRREACVAQEKPPVGA